MSNVMKPIRSEEDYSAALETINDFFDAPSGSEEADIRDVLILLVEKYEDEHYPVEKPDPIDAIKFRMEQQGLTQKDLIPYIGNRSKVSEVLSGKRDLSLKMIRALHKHMGIPAEVLLQERNPDLIENMADIDFDQFPIKEMKNHGAFAGINTSKIRDNAEEWIRALMDSIGLYSKIPELKFRKTKSSRLNSNANAYALQGWILHLLSVSTKIKVPVQYKSNTINDDFLKSLVHLSLLEQGPKLAQEFLLKHGIILAIIRHYKNTYLDGAAYITPEGQPVIGLTLRYDRIDNFWFNLCHELGHIHKHLNAGHYIADDMSLRGANTDDSAEKEADEFAERALLPESFDTDRNQIMTQQDVVSYALKYNIHPAIVAGKIQYLKNNYKLFSNLVGRGEVRGCFDYK